MDYHVILQDFTPLMVVVGAVIAGMAAWGAFKRQTIDDLKKAVEISRELAGVAKEQVDRQKGQIASLKTAQELQEKRILRLEIDNSRKQRRLLARDQETDILENIVRVAVSGLKTIDPIRAQVDILLADLAKFRRRVQDQQDEWEQTQTAMHSYLDSPTSVFAETVD